MARHILQKVSFIFHSPEDSALLHQPKTECGAVPFWTQLRNDLLTDGFDVEFPVVNAPRDADALLCYRLPPLGTMLQWLLQRKMHRSVFQQWEPPVIHDFDSEKNMRWIGRLFGTVLCWNDDLVDNKRFFKANPPLYRPNTQPPALAYADRKLLTNISGNKTIDAGNPSRSRELYSERVRAIRFMEQNHPADFTFYGIGWNVSKYPSYGGAVESKRETLEKFRFSVCFENMRDIKGYVTEKIFDCFDANCVPIYWGASNIEDIIPSDCYIDFRKFDGWESVYQYIKHMSEGEYNAYLAAKNRFALSSAYEPFLPEALIHATAAALRRVEAGVDYSYLSAWLAFGHMLWYVQKAKLKWFVLHPLAPAYAVKHWICRKIQSRK